ncbi:MAG: site-specific integrase, partial [Rhodobacteraceae bacterium]|nr:site-specific integrase [Paracoccaceae bacterium]
VARKGVRKSKVFPTRQEAKDWGARQEYLILNAETIASALSFGEVMDRMPGARWPISHIGRKRPG